VTYAPPYDLPPIDNTSAGIPEAERRAAFFRELDPFENIPPALLSSEHISDYVRVTGLLHPFYPEERRLKSASYEARAKRFIRWDDVGRKVVDEITPGHPYELPENSITFMQIESKIRLPEYIALRFNLRIKHVHRGLLLGTGPLVDPGFNGDLLIPLHNLTATKYVIDDGVIWIEFTKTTHNSKEWPSAGSVFYSIERYKTDVPFERYFERANRNNPIQSSIPAAITETRDQARSAAVSAKRAVRTNALFAGIGIVALAGLLIGASNLAVSVVRDAAQAAAEARRVAKENDALKVEIDGATRQNDALKSEIDGAKRQILELQGKFEALRSQPPRQGAPRP
jgi:deoxycytidine triphosphate deaminase